MNRCNGKRKQSLNPQPQKINFETEEVGNKAVQKYYKTRLSSYKKYPQKTSWLEIGYIQVVTTPKVLIESHRL